jgi:Tfp pilus assembly protein PilV
MTMKDQSGFTIVEVFVAALVLSFTLIGTVTIVRKSQEMISQDKNRRAARSYIVRTLENPAFEPENYAALTKSTAAQSVTINAAAGIQGTLTTEISDEQMQSGAADPYGTAVTIPYREITVTVKWSEMGNIKDSVQVWKRIANVQRR